MNRRPYDAVADGIFWSDDRIRHRLYCWLLLRIEVPREPNEIMTTFSQLVVKTACNMIQWAIDRDDPPPGTDAKLTELRASLDTEGNQLAADIAAQTPTKGT